jgi:hypothetical protein
VTPFPAPTGRGGSSAGLAAAVSEPLLAVHARCALIAWDDAPELTGAEQLWLAVEAAAAGLEERGPDEALCCLWERVPGTNPSLRYVLSRSCWC